MPPSQPPTVGQRTIFVAGVVALAIACGSDNLAVVPDTGGIEGYFCHPTTGALATDVTVSGPGIRTTVTADSDSVGFFRLTGLLTGSQTLSVTGADFQASLAVNVVADMVTRLPDPPCLQVPTGSVAGRICASDAGLAGGEGLWLPEARVFVSVGGETFETMTDGDGFFGLQDVPIGDHTLEVEKGSFVASAPISVTEGMETTIAPVCLEPTTELGVVTGIFDSVEDVLGDLGFATRECLTDDPGSCPSLDPSGNVTLIRGETSYFVTDLLEDFTLLSSFDVLFFNCGLADSFVRPPTPSAEANLRDFVDEGGSLYVSDWAYEVVRTIFPGVLDFYGDDLIAQVAKAGTADPNASAQVVDPALVSVLGTSNISIAYNKGDWAALDVSQDSNVRVWVRADVPIDTNGDDMPDTTLTGMPALVSVPYGQGRILFTTFHVDTNDTPIMREILEYIVFEL